MKRLIFLVFFLPHLAAAHPVSFEGGYSVMGELSEPLQNYYLLYSPKWWLGAGAVVETVEQERVYSSAQFAFLLKRWNKENAQANFYVLGGPGYYSNRVAGEVVDDGGFSRFGAQFDYETRRIYLNVRYIERRTWDGFDPLDNLIDAAVGFTPIVSNYEDLNVWFLVRYMDGEKMKEGMVSPTIRFFYKNFLWEAGMSTRGNAQLNFMIHM